MRKNLWENLKLNFRMPLFLVAASSATLASIATARCDTNSPASSAGKASNGVSWDTINGQSSRKSNSLQTVSAVNGAPGGSSIEWQTQNSTSSRRTTALQNGAKRQSNTVPWGQLQNSTVTKRTADQTETTSSRVSDHSSKRAKVPGAFGFSRQVPWQKFSVGSETPHHEGSSRVAWSALGSQNGEVVGGRPERQLDESASPSSMPLKLAVEQQPNAPLSEKSDDPQNITSEVRHSLIASVPWEQVAESQALTPLDDPTPMPVEPDSLSSTPEFALIEWPITDSIASLPVDQDISTSNQTSLDIAHSLIEEVPVVHTLSDKQELAPISEAITEDAQLLVDQVQSEVPGETVADETPALLVSKIARLTQEPSINLNQIATFQNQTSGTEPIGVLPIARLTQADTTRSVANTYSTEKYTGPMASAEELFYNLNVSGEFQNLSGETLQSQRTSSNPEATNFHWLPGFYTWASPSFYHRPLYFEQPNLERYGMGPHRCMQPLVSGMHFFGSIALMPYKMMTQHPYERVYSLGHQRPGDRACYQRGALLGQSQIGEVCRYWDEYSGYQ